jgi:polyisoprenoid-binding protein YceI
MTAPAATPVTTWAIDASHTVVEFAVKHLMITTVRGRFGAVEGTLTYDAENPSASSVQASIDVTSIDTRSEQRDGHLRSGDFFDAGQFPAMTFASRRVEGNAAGTFTLVGDLTIRDTTREVSLEVTSEGTARDPWGGDRMAFSGRTTIRRTDFGLSWNQALESGGVLVSDDVRITIEAQFVRQG